MRNNVNGQIRASSVRIIDENGDDLGVLAIADALSFVASRGIDLVEVNPETTPPVCQAIDYGKYRHRLERLAEDRRHD